MVPLVSLSSVHSSSEANAIEEINPETLHQIPGGRSWGGSAVQIR